jgi:hypothetical protein
MRTNKRSRLYKRKELLVRIIISIDTKELFVQIRVKLIRIANNPENYLDNIYLNNVYTYIRLFTQIP